jgi:hypothetical protein
MTTEDPRDTLEPRLLAEWRREIPDDGFSARVAAALPPAPVPRDWTLPLVAAAALAGCAVATFLVPVGPALLEGLRDLAASRTLTPAALGTLAALGALCATGAVVAADS